MLLNTALFEQFEFVSKCKMPYSANKLIKTSTDYLHNKCSQM